MNEFPSPNLTPEQLRKLEDDALLKRYEEANPEKFVVVEPEKRRDCEPEIAEFERMMAEFVQAYSLEALRSILTAEEALRNPVRESAKLALIPLCAKRNFLKNETDIDPERFAGLNIQWKKISNAVGLIHNGEVRHD